MSITVEEDDLEDRLDDLHTVEFESCAQVQIPDDYLRVDDAINFVGLVQHPKLWGQSKAFRTLNTRFDREACSYKHTYLELQGETWVRRTVEQSDDWEQPEGAITAHRLNFTVCRNILRAWEKGQFKLHLIHPTLGLLPPMPPGALHLQYDDVFRFGRGHAAISPPDMRYLIAVIDRKGFMGWLKRGMPGYENPAEPASSTKKATIHPWVSKPVIDLITAKEMMVTKRWLWDVLRAGRDPASVSGAQFVELIWNELDERHKCRGRASKAQQKAMDSIKVEAFDLAKARWRGSSKGNT